MTRASALTALHSAQAAADWLRVRASAGQLTSDSRSVQPGDAFIAWPGAAADGRRYVLSALKAGAVACLVEGRGCDASQWPEWAPVGVMDGLKPFTGEVAAGFYGHPARAMAVLAVTGTNGKTSTAWWLAMALNALPEQGICLLSKKKHQIHKQCAMAGTLGIGVPPDVVFNGLTTPDPVLLQRSLARLASQGVNALAIEASSIGLAEGRLAGLDIDVAIFTNLTQDHLDYHGSMDAYWAAKCTLFSWPGLQAAVINMDDPRGEDLSALASRSPTCAVWTYGVATAEVRVAASEVRCDAQGLRFTLVVDGQQWPVSTRIAGLFHVHNLLGVTAALLSLGVPVQAIVPVLSQLRAPPGRLEAVEPEAERPCPSVWVDYAHTPDAVAQVLSSLQPVAQARGGRVCVVLGCGGDRDATKRPLMARAAESGADRVILTSDNPRHESPQTIVEHMMAGLQQPQNAQVVMDRREAIRMAVATSRAADVVLIAGKGHENYQDIAGEKWPFDDRVEASKALGAWLHMASAECVQ
jgi:UDP-N-acetylmuramoyl-L-alanyl-D-glutamate--2,6-diaminopimelate ligase